jgi:hypothetical protein
MAAFKKINITLVKGDKMARKLQITALIVLIVAITPSFLFAGNLDSPGAPGSTAGYTLTNIYDRLASGWTGDAPLYTEPAAAPGSTGYTTDQIMAIAPSVDDTNGAVASDVLAGKTFWGLNSGAWGLQTGTATAGTAVNGADGLKTFTIPDGLYSGSLTATANDPSLVSTNIRNGVNIFGVSGDINVVNTSSGDAAASDIKSGKIAWVDGGAVTGTMAPAPVQKPDHTTGAAGVQWPNPRFTPNGDGTVTDNLTGLVWLQNANCTETVGGVNKDSGQLNWTDAQTWCGALATGSCGLGDGSAAGTWRLPTINEMLSLMHWGFQQPPISNDAGSGQWGAGGTSSFTNIAIDAGYWTGTVTSNPAQSWSIDTDFGQTHTTANDAGTLQYVWAVKD